MKRRRENLPRRRYRRLTVRVQVEYSAGTGTRCDLATTLGAGGLFVATEDPLEARTRLQLCFRMPGDPSPWKLEGRVAWSGDSGMGIEFLDRSAIARLAHRLEGFEED